MRTILALISIILLVENAEAACSTSMLKGEWVLSDESVDCTLRISSTGVVGKGECRTRGGSKIYTAAHPYEVLEKGRLKISSSCELTGTLQIEGEVSTLNGYLSLSGNVALGNAQTSGYNKIPFNLIKGTLAKK